MIVSHNAVMRKLFFRGILIFKTILMVSLTYAQQPATAEKFKQELLYDINTTRQKGCNCGTKWFPPAPPVTWNTILQKSAYGHARDMNDRNYFSHTGKDGRSMEDRIQQSGYNVANFKAVYFGENIAKGQPTIQAVMQDWFKSEGHCKNLMNANFKEVGVVQYNDYWVQDFGGRELWPPALQRHVAGGQVKLGPPVRVPVYK